MVRIRPGHWKDTHCVSTLLYRLGAFCARRAWLVLLVWACVVAVVATGWVLLGARTSNDIRLPGTETQAATDFLAKEFPPQQNGQSPVVFHAAQGTLLDPAARRAVEESVRRMKAVPHVSSVTSPFARGARSLLMSEDEKTAIAQVLLDVNGGQVTRELASEVMAAAQPARDAGLQVEAGGVLGVRLSEEKSRRSEMIGLAVGIVILAITFGALVAAGMPIITAIVALVTGLGLIGLLGHVVDIPVVAPTLATMLGLGVGIDYALFIVFRYRDELHGGADVREAVARAMATSGSAVVFAGVTVIIALLSLLVARVPLIGAMGYASALAVLVAVLTAITFLPAVLGVVGRRIDALRLPWRRGSGARARGGQHLGALGGRGDPAPVDQPHRRAGGAAAAGGADADADPGPGGHRRLAHVDDPAPRYDLISAGARAGRQRPSAGGHALLAGRPSRARRTRPRRTRAERLARELEKDAARLKRQGKALERRGEALKADKAALERRAAALKARQAALEAQAAPLLARKDALLAQQQQLLAQKTRLLARAAALAAQGAALRGRRASSWRRRSPRCRRRSRRPRTRRSSPELQAQLMALLQQAQERPGAGRRPAEGGGGAQEEGARRWPPRAGGSRRQGAALQAESAALTAQGAALRHRARGSPPRAPRSRSAARRSRRTPPRSSARSGGSSVGPTRRAVPQEGPRPHADRRRRPAARHRPAAGAPAAGARGRAGRPVRLAAERQRERQRRRVRAHGDHAPADPVTSDLVSRLRTHA